MLGVAIGTMALVIVLSVFNGLGDFIRDLYSSFDPELKIVPIKGKTFMINDFPLASIKGITGIAGITQVIEESAYVRYRDQEMVVTIKGVSDNFQRENRLRNHMVEGKLKLTDSLNEYAVLGRGVEYALNITSLNDIYPIEVFYPKKNSSLIDPLNAINRRSIMPAGVFAIEKQFDVKYMITSLRFAEGLFDYNGKRTSLEINLNNPAEAGQIKSRIQSVLGRNFKILDRDEQHASLIRAIKWEKLFVYFTLSVIIAIVAINIFISLTMLAIDKRKDIAILLAMGADKNQLRNIFFKEGAIIAFSGALTGMILGVIICFIQEEFGIIPLGIETSVIRAYPVKMDPLDFLLTALSVVLITVLFSLRPAILASRNSNLQYL